MYLYKMCVAYLKCFGLPTIYFVSQIKDLEIFIFIYTGKLKNLAVSINISIYISMYRHIYVCIYHLNLYLNASSCSPAPSPSLPLSAYS